MSKKELAEKTLNPKVDAENYQPTIEELMKEIYRLSDELDKVRKFANEAQKELQNYKESFNVAMHGLAANEAHLNLVQAAMAPIINKLNKGGR